MSVAVEVENQERKSKMQLHGTIISVFTIASPKRKIIRRQRKQHVLKITTKQSDLKKKQVGADPDQIERTNGKKKYQANIKCLTIMCLQ